MILYPTETVYGLGVNALDEAAHQQLCELKGRDSAQAVSWLVRDVSDIERYGVLGAAGRAIAETFLPGSLTLVLLAKDTVPGFRSGAENEVSFRISPDPVAQQLIEEFMAEHDAPLTCTSANVHGQSTLSTPADILEQFGQRAEVITRVIDDGERAGLPSTVVKVLDDQITILRERAVPAVDILAMHY